MNLNTQTAIAAKMKENCQHHIQTIFFFWTFNDLWSLVSVGKVLHYKNSSSMSICKGIQIWKEWVQFWL